VSTLYAIVTALGISVEDLFAPGLPEAGVPEVASVTTADGTAVPTGEVGPVGADGPSAAAPTVPLSVAQALQQGTDRERRVGPVVHPDDREALTLESGVTWELLGQVPGVHVDFLLVTYQPGGSSSVSGALMRHSGTEYGYLISGALILTLGFDEHHLRAGDAISFDSTTPHGYRNEGDEPAIGVWFVADRGH
jgi:quercetin dioxygenase-like cupin family protein